MRTVQKQPISNNVNTQSFKSILQQIMNMSSISINGKYEVSNNRFSTLQKVSVNNINYNNPIGA